MALLSAGTGIWNMVKSWYSSYLEAYEVFTPLENDTYMAESLRLGYEAIRDQLQRVKRESETEAPRPKRFLDFLILPFVADFFGGIVTGKPPQFLKARSEHLADLQQRLQPLEGVHNRTKRDEFRVLANNLVDLLQTPMFENKTLLSPLPLHLQDKLDMIINGSSPAQQSRQVRSFTKTDPNAPMSEFSLFMLFGLIMIAIMSCCCGVAYAVAHYSEKPNPEDPELAQADLIFFPVRQAVSIDSGHLSFIGDYLDETIQEEPKPYETP